MVIILKGKTNDGEGVVLTERYSWLGLRSTNTISSLHKEMLHVISLALSNALQEPSTKVVARR